MKVNISSAALRRKYQQGLTLIELLVVLFILAAVAGVAIGIVPNVQKRTHGATSAASIRAGESALTAELFTGGLLNGGFDGLVNAGGTAIPDYVGETAAEGFQLVTLDAAQADALQDLGIDEVHPAAADSFADLLTAGGENATFDGHDYVNVTAVAAAAVLAGLGADSIIEVADQFNIDAPDAIFAFGLGRESDLVGLNRSFKVAPVHTPGEGSAATTYSRYAILVGYDAAEAEAFYIGMTCIDDGEEFKTIDGNLAEFYEATN